MDFPQLGRFSGGPILQPIIREGIIAERTAGGEPNIEFGANIVTVRTNGSSGYLRIFGSKGVQIRGTATGATPPYTTPVLLLSNSEALAADRQWCVVGFGTSQLQAELHVDPNSLRSGADHPSVVLSARGSILVEAKKEVGGTLQLGFFGATPVAKPDIAGAKGGNVALANLLTALANLGILTDSTT